jgi:predicted transport protein
MPLFKISGNDLVPVEQINFSVEKELQALIEKNLAAVFNCRLVASEFFTGTLHAGRIDTLALSEDNNPVIIEYKKVETSELINQSLFYLHWIQDHKGDFKVAAQQALGNGVEVDWSDVRVICIAPNYKKYDLHAVQVMGANIELWKYRLFKNGSLYLEEVFQATKIATAVQGNEKNPVMVAAGKKAAQVRATATYTFEEHLKEKPKAIQSLMHNLREFIVSLDPAIKEVPKKYYIAYKISQNIVCMEPRSRNLKLFLKLKALDIGSPPKFYRDVTEIGHYGTGGSEFTVGSEETFEQVKPFIELAYNKVGG